MSNPRPTTAIVGAGKLAGALLPALLDAGYPVVAVASPGGRSARALVRRHRGPAATADPDEATTHARLVLLAVPDREIAGLARRLAAGRAWKRSTVVHHAGVLGTDVLRPLALRDAAVGVVHPMQTLDAALPGAALDGAYARIEADDAVLPRLRRLARALGLRPFRVARRWTPSSRAAYHAAASLASNDVLALLEQATRLLSRTGITPQDARRALLVLTRGTLDRIEHQGFEGALTGPVVRGDRATLEAHLRVLGRHAPELERVHRLLSRRLAKIARRAGRRPASKI